MLITLTPVDSARNLGIILSWIKIFLFLNTSHLIPNPASSIFVIYGVFEIFGSFSTASTIAATSLIHSKIDYCNSLLLNLPVTQINRLQLVLNSAARVPSPELQNVIM
jgi:hypothetical protein